MKRVCCVLLLYSIKVVPCKNYYPAVPHQCVFTIISTIKHGKFHHSSTIIGRISLFVYDIYSTAVTHSTRCASAAG